MLLRGPGASTAPVLQPAQLTPDPESGGKPLAGEGMTSWPFLFDLYWHLLAIWLPTWPQEGCGNAVRVIVTLLDAAICIRSMLCAESLGLMAHFTRRYHYLCPPHPHLQPPHHIPGLNVNVLQRINQLGNLGKEKTSAQIINQDYA